jgi:hypothetical protein
MSLLLAVFEPATTAASMAINRPGTIDDAPARGPERSGGWRRRDFLGSRGIGAAGVPALRGGKPRGRKSRRPPLRQSDEACRPVARSRHQEAAGSRARQPLKEKTWQTWVRARGQAQRAKEQKPWRTERRSQPSGTRPAFALQAPGSVGCGSRAVRSKRRGGRVVDGQI